MRLSYETARSCLTLIASLSYKGYLSNLGISQADYEKLTGDAPWIGSDRNRMTNVLTTLANGALLAQALPLFTLPAEYIAACIITFVAPVNIMPACEFMSKTPSAQDLGEGMDALQAPKVTATQLFSLCQQLCTETAHSNARASFEAKLSIISSQLPENNQEAGNGSRTVSGRR